MNVRHGLPLLGEFFVRLAVGLRVSAPNLRTVATQWIRNFPTAAGCTPKLDDFDGSTAHSCKGFAYVTAAPAFC